MQRAESGGKWKEYSSVLSGVPQGSVLGPLLFLIYVDGLAQLPLLDGGQTVLYADDLLLFRPIKGSEDFSHLQHDISQVEEWVNHNHQGWVNHNYRGMGKSHSLPTSHLTLNLTKCKCMTISRKRNPSLPQRLILGGSDLEQVQCFKYLGLLLSTNLTGDKKATVKFMHTLQIVHNLSYFLQEIVVPRPNFSQRSSNQYILQQPFARTNAFLHSLVPRTVNAWNSLPNSLIFGCI